MSEQTFFAGFAWSVPSAFCDPLGACRFEEGDSLYDTKDGYLQWDEGLKGLKYGIQIREPKKTAKGALKEDEDAIFARNWLEPVTFELTRYQQNKRELITTTQGRLYSFLRTGDFAFLDAKTQAPIVPILVIEANRLLEQIDKSALRKLSEGMEKPHIFIMASDPTNPVSRAKLIDIRRCLGEYELREATFTPQDLKLANADGYAPTISYVAFATDTGATEKMRDCLKRVLYKPSKIRKTTTDRFQLRRHGLLIPPKEKSHKNLITISLAHGDGHFYRFRLDSERAKKAPQALQDFFACIVSGDCPNHFFQEPPYSSKLHLELPMKPTRDRLNKITDLAGASFGNVRYKSDHENLQTYFHEVDEATVATEVPVWIDCAEYADYKEVFPDGGVLTGHIDILRCEADGKIGIWDFKPGAFQERYAAGQVYSYAVMLSHRTGMPLSDMRCGYFDASDAFIFEPANVRWRSSEGL